MGETASARRPGLARSILRGLVPGSVRQRLRRLQYAYFLRSAMHRIMALPPGAVPDRALLRRLEKGWTNGGWSAHLPLLEHLAGRLAALEREGRAVNVLECGSGLSTLLMAAMTTRTRIRIDALEHIPEWAAKLSAVLERFGLDQARVHVAPLVDYGAFEWYSRVDVLPEQIHLVFCDGPPASTRGGRAGLLPVAGDRLAPDAVVLVDDAEREDEQRMVAEWTASGEWRATVQIAGEAHFAVVTRAAGAR